MPTNVRYWVTQKILHIGLAASVTVFALLGNAQPSSVTQASNGLIAGSVVDQVGAPVSGIGVVIQRVGGPKLTGPFRSQLSTSDGSGSFFFNALPAGLYQLCPQGAAKQLVEPCVWSDAPPAVSLGIGEKKLGYRVVLRKGALLNIRIDDEDSDKPLGKKNAKGEELNRVQVEVVVSGRGRRVNVPRMGQDANGQNFTIVAPIDTAFRLDVRSSTLDVKGKGNSAAFHVNEGVTVPGANPGQSGKQVDEVRVNSGENVKEFRFSAQGKGK